MLVIIYLLDAMNIPLVLLALSAFIFTFFVVFVLGRIFGSRIDRILKNITSSF
jgi:hypothetical protein